MKLPICVASLCVLSTNAFTLSHYPQNLNHNLLPTTRIQTSMFSTDSDTLKDEGGQVKKERKRDKVMAFLRRKNAVGPNKDFSTAMGVDEGPVGKNLSPVKGMQKAKSAYKWCTDSGIIDEITESFPMTTSGSQWAGYTDQVMGGVSNGKLMRETLGGRLCNVMKGKVSLYNHGGFIQMATDLTTDPAVSLTVDASGFDGVELDVYGTGEVEKFNVHLRNKDCKKQSSSYRGTFEAAPDQWTTVRLPFSEFVGHETKEVPLDLSELRRMAIVAIGKKMDVYLGVGRVVFYKD